MYLTLLRTIVFHKILWLCDVCICFSISTQTLFCSIDTQKNISGYNFITIYICTIICSWVHKKIIYFEI